MIITAYISVILLVLVISFRKRHYKDIIQQVPIPLFVIEIARILLNEYSDLEGYNGLIFVYLCSLYIYFFKIFKPDKYFKSILISVFVFIFYLLFRLSYDPSFGISPLNLVSRYGNFIVIIGFMVLGYFSYRGINDIININRVLIWLAFIHILIVILFSLFQIGRPLYRGGFLYGLLFQQWYYLPFIVLLFPLIIIIQGNINTSKYKIKNKYLYGIVFLSLFISAISLRRTTWLIILFGVIPYVVHYARKLRNIKYIVAITIVFSIVSISVMYSGIMDIRSSRFDQDYNAFEDEHRFLEIFLVHDIVTSDDNSLLFGTGELFAETGRYGHPKDTRPIHGTYTRVYFGGGLVGLILYFGMFSIIIIKSLKSYFLKNRYRQLIQITSLTIISLTLSYIVALFSGAMGTGAGVLYVVTNYLYTGMLFGLLKQLRS